MHSRLNSNRSRWSVSWTWTVVGFTTIVALPDPTQAQEGFRMLPGGELPRILVAPREPEMAIRVIGVGKGATAFRSGVEWEADLGHGIPFMQLAGSSPDHSVVLGIQAGVFGRFSLETVKRDMISSDWVFQTPVFIRSGPNWVRISYRHISSHLGDDYIARFDVEREGYMRDDVDLTLYRAVTTAVSLYGSMNYAFNVEPNVNKRAAVSAGFELNGQRQLERTTWYGGVDLNLDQDSSWDPRVNVHVGRWLVMNQDAGLRFTMEALIGPSTQGQFRRSKVATITIGLAVEI
jgi:Protein of unknown function (DUF1207)